MTSDPTQITLSQPPPAKRPRGRPRTFDEQRRHTLCTMLSVGFSRREACRHVGVVASSVAHAARTDPLFAQQLQQALIDRANRPPELADIGSRSWRAYARRLEACSAHFRRPSSRKPRLSERSLKRMVRRMVNKVLRQHPLWAAAASSPRSPIDYCSKTPHVVRASALQKQ